LPEVSAMLELLLACAFEKFSPIARTTASGYNFARTMD
jgi:hypothetical protein